MEREPNSGSAGFPFSTKDTILGILFTFSGLLAFGLSFTLTQSDGRPYLFCFCLAVCILSLLFTKQKKEIFWGTIVFILLRLAWATVITGLQMLHSGRQH
jgi:glucose dehydrogenase